MKCPFKCIHCKNRLKRNKTIEEQYLGVIAYDCQRCMEVTLLPGAVFPDSDSKFCIAYDKSAKSSIPGANILWYVEVCVGEYRILVNHKSKTTHISKGTKTPRFSTSPMMWYTHYEKLIEIQHAVDFDLEDKDNLLEKIKFLVTYS